MTERSTITDPLARLAPRSAITSPRDLALPGRVLSSALALLDGLNPFPAPQPVELEFAGHDRAGQVAAFLAWRAVIADHSNALRRAEWRARYGGKEAAGQLIGVTVTPKAARFEGRGFRPKSAQPTANATESSGPLRLVTKGKAG